MSSQCARLRPSLLAWSLLPNIVEDEKRPCIQEVQEEDEPAKKRDPITFVAAEAVSGCLSSFWQNVIGKCKSARAGTSLQAARWLGTQQIAIVHSAAEASRDPSYHFLSTKSPLKEKEWLRKSSCSPICLEHRERNAMKSSIRWSGCQSIQMPSRI